MFVLWCCFVLFLCSCVECDCDARVLGTGTGPTDHWPLAFNAEACKLEHCAMEMAACVLDQTCLESVTCPASCTGGSFTSGLCAYECGEAGTRSDKYMAMMICFGVHRCQESRTTTAGPCAATSLGEGRQDVTSLDQLAGHWWITRAWNCASGITFASCQHHFFQIRVKMKYLYILVLNISLIFGFQGKGTNSTCCLWYAPASRLTN